MSALDERTWKSIYESRPSHGGSYLVDEFYIPALKRSVQYDRIAGYFSSSVLAVASREIDSLLGSDRLESRLCRLLELSNQFLDIRFVGDFRDVIGPTHQHNFSTNAANGSSG